MFNHIKPDEQNGSDWFRTKKATRGFHFPRATAVPIRSTRKSIESHSTVNRDFWVTDF